MPKMQVNIVNRIFLKKELNLKWHIFLQNLKKIYDDKDCTSAYDIITIEVRRY